MVIYIGVGSAGIAWFDALIERILPSGSIWNYLKWLVRPLAIVVYLLFVFSTFTLVAKLLGAPFDGVLAAEVERHLTGRLTPASPNGIWKEILPAILGELQKLLYFCLLAFPVIVLLIIPVLNPLGSVLWVLLGLWCLTIEYCDYPMGNHGLRPKRTRELLRQCRVRALAFGAGAAVLLLMPIVQLVAMPALVAGATRFWITKFDAGQLALGR